MPTPMLDRRSLLLAAAALPLSACATGGTPQRLPIRVAIFNIWHDAGNWAARQPLLVQALREADADVIALQEVLEDADKGLPNQADTLARELGGYSVHFMSTTPEGEPRRYGNAILSRLPVVGEASKKLEPLNDYRTALRVRVKAAGRFVDIVNTHLAWKADQGPVRAMQIADLISWLPQDGVPLVLLGDFNAELSDPGLASLTGPRFKVVRLPDSIATTLNTAKGHAPRIVDHIFAERRWFTVTDARLLGDRPLDGEYPSDHFGVAATLHFT